jgi:ABC-type transport system substrate-binding protein
MAPKFDRLFLDRGGLKTDYINMNWLEIIGLASTHQTTATDFYQCISANANKFNTAMYGPWGREFRTTLTSVEAKQAYTDMYRSIGADLTLLILAEMLRFCNSTGGVSYYKDFFKPLIDILFSSGTIVERGAIPPIGQIDVSSGKLFIN